MNTHSDQASQTAELFERPSYRERANRRFLYVLVPCVAINVAGVLTAGLSGWAAVGAVISGAYGTAILAAILTLLVALAPGRPRRVSRTGTQ